MGLAPRRLLSRLTGLLLLGLAGYYALWGGEYTAADLLRLSQRQRAEQASLAELRLQVDSLRALVRRLESDPATIEAVARERFGMIRQGEILYRFVDLEAPEPNSRPVASPVATLP